MILADYIRTLNEEERDFIANLDYGYDFSRHRMELDSVIENSGDVDFSNQIWFPYEVIELGKNGLHDGHEREFAACAGIVMHNIITGADQMNDLDIGLGVVIEHLNKLDDNLRLVLDPLLDSVIEEYEE